MGRPAIQFVGLFCAEARRGFDSGGCELPLFGYCFKECVWRRINDTVSKSVSGEG